MRKIVLSLVLFVLFSFGFSSTATDSTSSVQIELKTYLESNTVPKNREVVYHVELSWKGDLDRFHILGVNEPSVSNLQIRGSGSSNKFFIDNDGNPLSIKRITYYFLPKELGMAYIDGLVIRYEDTVRGKVETLTAQRLQVSVTDPVSDNSSAANVGVIIFWILLFLFLATVAFFVYRYFQRRDAAGQGEDVVQKTAEEEKLERLQDIDADKNMKYNEKVQAMSSLLNHYFSEKFDLEGQVEFKDIEEKLKSLSIEERLLNKIKEFMEQALLAKFAGKDVSETDYQLYYDTLEQTFRQMNEIESKTEEEE